MQLSVAKEANFEIGVQSVFQPEHGLTGQRLSLTTPLSHNFYFSLGYNQISDVPYQWNGEELDYDVQAPEFLINYRMPMLTSRLGLSPYIGSRITQGKLMHKDDVVIHRGDFAPFVGLELNYRIDTKQLVNFDVRLAEEFVADKADVQFAVGYRYQFEGNQDPDYPMASSRRQQKRQQPAARQSQPKASETTANMPAKTEQNTSSSQPAAQPQTTAPPEAMIVENNVKPRESFDIQVAYITNKNSLMAIKQKYTGFELTLREKSGGFAVLIESKHNKGSLQQILSHARAIDPNIFISRQ